MCCRVTPKSVACQLALLKLRIRTAPPPSSVILLPPSITVFLLTGKVRVAVTGIVTAPPPQSKVITPPAAAAVCSAANVQRTGAPVPITAVGLDVSTGWPLVGTPARHEPLGLPAPPVPVGAPPPPPSGARDEPELQPKEAQVTTGNARANARRMRHLA